MISAVSVPSSSLAALRVLQAVNRDLDATQVRLATGKRVNRAADSPAVWSMAKGIESENRTSAAVRAGLDMAAGRASSASQSLGKAVDLLSDLKSAMFAATAPGVDRATVAENIRGIQSSLTALVSGSTIGGSSWLTGGEANVTTGVGATGVTVSTVDLSGADLAGRLSAEGEFGAVPIERMAAPEDAEQAALFIADLDAAISGLKLAAATLGATAARFEGQATFMLSLEGVRASAISKLVDVDVEEETARLAALQVRQELATTALSISNASMRNVLRLFQ